MNSITAKDLAKGLVITQPGHYRLTESVEWATDDANARAITIACDNVTLDLGGHTLRQVGKPTPLTDNRSERACKGSVVSGNVAIWADARKGLVIRNGTVCDVQGVGVCLKDCVLVDLLDLRIHGCGGDGVVDTSFLCRNGGLFVMGTSAAREDAIVWSTDIRIINCVCTDNSSPLDYVVTLGSLVQNCRNVTVKHSVFNRTVNSSAQPSGVQFNVVGIDFVMCRNVLVADCEAHENSSGGEPAGFFAWGENYKFVDCRANGNYTLTGHRACGFNISTTAHLEMVDCEANGNFNANPQAAGDAMKDFSACGFRIGRAVNRAVLENCRASGNHSIGQHAPVAGFMLNSARNVLLKNCTATANRSATGNRGGSAFAAGFLASTVQPAADGGLWGGEFNSFVHCVADGNTVDRVPMHQHPPYPHVDRGERIAGDPMTGAGFLLDGQSHPKILDCIAINNHGKGMWLRNSRHALVQGSTLAHNSLLGIHDETPTGPNLIVDNRLRSNGDNPQAQLLGVAAAGNNCL